MGVALAVGFCVCLLLAVINYKSEESAEIKSQTQKLPDGASVFFDKRISGRSRKGVVTYYSHFVRAVYCGYDGISLQEIFPFDHHDSSDKAAAWGKAHSWVNSTHSNLVSNTQSLPQAAVWFQPGVTTFEQVKARLGVPQTVTDVEGGYIEALWARPKAVTSSPTHSGVTVLFDKEGVMLSSVSGEKPKDG